MPALSYFDYLYGATSELLMYLLHLFASHSFRFFRVSVLFNVYSRLLGRVRPLAYYWFQSSALSILDSAGFL